MVKLTQTDKKYIAYAIVGLVTIALTIYGVSLLPIQSQPDAPYSNQVVGIAFIVSAGLVWVFIFAMIRVKRKKSR